MAPFAFLTNHNNNNGDTSVYSFQDVREFVQPHIRNKPGYYMQNLSGNRFEISFHAPGASLDSTICTASVNEARWYDQASFTGLAFNLPLLEEFLSLVTWTIKDGIFYAVLQYTKPERYRLETRQSLIPEQYEAIKKSFVSPGVTVVG